MDKINYNYWKTEDKQIIKITDMSIDHLKNTINLIKNKWLPELEKNFEHYKTCFYATTWNDQFPFDDVRDYNSTFEILENYVKTMKLELASRKV